MNFCTETRTDPFTEITDSIANTQNFDAYPSKPQNCLNSDELGKNTEFHRSSKITGLVNYVFKKEIQGNENMLGTSMNINVFNGTQDYVDNESGELRVKGTYLPMNERIKQKIIGEDNHEPNFDVLSLEEIFVVLDQLQVKYRKNSHKSYLLSLLKKYQINDYMKL